MKFKGTNSKWGVYGNNKTEIVDEKGKWIADAGVSIELNLDEKIANAKLISASKYLLFACNRAKQDIINGVVDKTTIDALDNALYKAL